MNSPQPATLLLAPCLLLMGVPQARSATRHVPADHKTIQSAIDAATGGDTVIVAAGTYMERVRLQTGITLKSAGDDAKGKLGLKRAESTILDERQQHQILATCPVGERSRRRGDQQFGSQLSSCRIGRQQVDHTSTTDRQSCLFGRRESRSCCDRPEKRSRRGQPFGATASEGGPFASCFAPTQIRSCLLLDNRKPALPACHNTTEPRLLEEAGVLFA